MVNGAFWAYKTGTISMAYIMSLWTTGTAFPINEQWVHTPGTTSKEAINYKTTLNPIIAVTKERCRYNKTVIRGAVDSQHVPWRTCAVVSSVSILSSLYNDSVT